MFVSQTTQLTDHELVDFLLLFFFCQIYSLSHNPVDHVYQDEIRTLDTSSGSQSKHLILVLVSKWINLNESLSTESCSPNFTSIQVPQQAPWTLVLMVYLSDKGESEF